MTRLFQGKTFNIFKQFLQISPVLWPHFSAFFECDVNCTKKKIQNIFSIQNLVTRADQPILALGDCSQMTSVTKRRRGIRPYLTFADKGGERVFCLFCFTSLMDCENHLSPPSTPPDDPRDTPISFLHTNLYLIVVPHKEKDKDGSFDPARWRLEPINALGSAKLSYPVKMKKQNYNL